MTPTSSDPVRPADEASCALVVRAQWFRDGCDGFEIHGGSLWDGPEARLRIALTVKALRVLADEYRRQPPGTMSSDAVVAEKLDGLLALLDPPA